MRDPMFLFVIVPLALLNFIAAVFFTIHDWPYQHPLHLGWALSALLLLLIPAKSRIFSLGVQDRVIRLEERMRLARLSPALDVHQLSTPQLIALRFASDAELPALAARTIVEKLEPNAIKQSIVNWRADHQRI